MCYAHIRVCLLLSSTWIYLGSASKLWLPHGAFLLSRYGWTYDRVGRFAIVILAGFGSRTTCVVVADFKKSARSLLRCRSSSDHQGNTPPRVGWISTAPIWSSRLKAFYGNRLQLKAKPIYTGLFPVIDVGKGKIRSYFCGWIVHTRRHLFGTIR